MQPRLESVQCLHPGGLHRMAYAEWGERENPDVVVCVHGLSRNGRDFDTLAKALAGRHRVVCPDIVGRGRSDRLTDYRGYTFPQYVADCITLIARLDVSRVSWVGTSMGGYIGMMIAAMQDNPIVRFVINDVGPVIGRAGIERIGRAVGTTTTFATFEDGVKHVSTVSATFGPHTPEQWRMLSEHIVVREPDGTWRLHYDPRIGDATREDIARPVTADLWPLWDRVRCPTLLLRGAESDLLEESVAQAMTARGPRASLITYPGVGHAPTLMQPDQVKDVVDFIDGITTPRSST
jgi:pimeloyl-ACP methyl ester carboxylesterase